jgi:hypothetical protein
MQPFGNFKREIMIVGEGPGKTEDRRGKPWQGRAGGVVKGALEDLGINLFEDCVSVNAVNCFPPPTQVKLPSKVMKAYRRNYSGQMVRVTTSSGNKLSGTPNHPIFTKLGKIPLGSIKPGDEVVKCSDRYWESNISRPDVQTPPTEIEKVFNGLLDSAWISTAMGAMAISML